MKRLIDLFKNEDVWIDSFPKQAKQDKTLFEDLRRELVSRRYSPKTIKAYSHYNEDLVRLTDKEPDSITEGDISIIFSTGRRKRRLSHLFEKLKE